MLLSEILRHKGGNVHTISPDSTLADVVDKLVAENCGSLVVCNEDESMAGIITERDILRACAAKKGALDSLSTSDHMTKDVHTGALQDTIDTTMAFLSEKRIRHLPILDGGKLAGLISIGDVVNARGTQIKMELEQMRNYIQS